MVSGWVFARPDTSSGIPLFVSVWVVSSDRNLGVGNEGESGLVEIHRVCYRHTGGRGWDAWLAVVCTGRWSAGVVAGKSDASVVSHSFDAGYHADTTWLSSGSTPPVCPWRASPRADGRIGERAARQQCGGRPGRDDQGNPVRHLLAALTARPGRGRPSCQDPRGGRGGGGLPGIRTRAAAGGPPRRRGASRHRRVPALPRRLSPSRYL